MEKLTDLHYTIHALIHLQLVKFTHDFISQVSTKNYLALYLSEREINTAGSQSSYISPV